MPRYDGTGPQGTGPAGRGLGPCEKDQTSNRWNLFGLRRGWGGRGRGFRWFSRAPLNEREDLESEKSWLTSRLNVINKRMDDLQKEE